MRRLCDQGRGGRWLILLAFCAACQDSSPAPPAAPAAEPARVEGAAAAPTPPAVGQEALPRAVAGIALGMRRAAAQERLGPLACHPNPAGFEVCSPTEPLAAVRHLELYVFRDAVISLSYEEPTGVTAPDILEQAVQRYGPPALSGVRERDRSGRVHETYGWKDGASLYSVRFIWQDAEAGARTLAGTVIAIWDREAYQRWEGETQPQREPPPDGERPQAPV